MNFIGIRIIPPREINSFINGNNYEKNIKIWKKDRAVSLINVGCHKYFGISSTNLSNESEFDISNNATKTQIKNAFAKSLKSKKMNRKILGEFVELLPDKYFYSNR